MKIPHFHKKFSPLVPDTLHSPSGEIELVSHEQHVTDEVRRGDLVAAHSATLTARQAIVVKTTVEKKIEDVIASHTLVDDGESTVRLAALKPRATRSRSALPIETATLKVPVIRPRVNRSIRWEIFLVVGILLIAGVAHGFNMFHFPYFEDDEGTYISQAWAVMHIGHLAYYTYWYDHAPVGWFQIALWTILTGGFHTFGPAIDSGRVLMLLMQVGSTFLVYRIGRSVSKSFTVAVIASLLFALSPYGLYFHRRVLLDNITTFWMLLSILPLVSGRLSLTRVWLSALALGISILSKEATIFLIPVMTILVFLRSDKSHRWFATIGWLTVVSSLLSMYVLMAAVNSELFPSGTLLGGTNPHVSLLNTLLYQASRGKDRGIFDMHSAFWILIRIWMGDEPMLIGVGSLCAILSIVTIKWQRLVGMMGLVTLSLWAFLGRGGQVLGFYLVPLLPLLALNVGFIVGSGADKLKAYAGRFTRNNKVVGRTIQIAAVVVCLLGILGGYNSPNLKFQSNHLMLWNSSQADAQNQAVEWVSEHIPTRSYIVADEYMWTDLYDKGYKFVHYYWKVQLDPAIRDNVFHNNWHNIDYVITTDQLLTDVRTQNMNFVGTALAHSTLLIHMDTDGWPLEIRKVNK